MNKAEKCNQAVDNLKVQSPGDVPKDAEKQFYEFLHRKQIMEYAPDPEPPPMSNCCEASVFYCESIDENICTNCQKICRIK